MIAELVAVASAIDAVHHNAMRIVRMIIQTKRKLSFDKEKYTGGF